MNSSVQIGFDLRVDLCTFRTCAYIYSTFYTFPLFKCFQKILRSQLFRYHFTSPQQTQIDHDFIHVQYLDGVHGDVYDDDVYDGDHGDDHDDDHGDVHDDVYGDDHDGVYGGDYLHQRHLFSYFHQLQRKQPQEPTQAYLSLRMDDHEFYFLHIQNRNRNQGIHCICILVQQLGIHHIHHIRHIYGLVYPPSLQVMKSINFKRFVVKHHQIYGKDY